VASLLDEKGAAAAETQAAIQRILLVARIDVGVLLLVVADMLLKPFSRWLLPRRDAAERTTRFAQPRRLFVLGVLDRLILLDAEALDLLLDLGEVWRRGR